MAINLQDFLNWYKQSEVVLWENKWIFREPKMKDMNGKINVQEILRNNCFEWDVDKFFDIVNNELSKSQQTELIKSILSELGLV